MSPNSIGPWSRDTAKIASGSSVGSGSGVDVGFGVDADFGGADVGIAVGEAGTETLHGFTSEAVQAVIGRQALATDRFLVALADRSLIQHGPDGRYSMHTLLRQYAAEKLGASSAARETATQRHAAFYMDFLAEQGSGEEADQRATISADLANIHAAFQFALDQIADQPVAASEQASVLCDLLGRQAQMYIHIGQVEIARPNLEKAQSYLHQVESVARRSVFLGYLAITTYYAGDCDRATELAEESLRLSEETDDQDGIGAATALNNLGNLAQATHDYADARRYYRECSDLFKADGHVHGAASTLANAGRLALRQQAYDDARQLLTESLALKQEMNDQRGMAVALVSLGDVSVATGAYSDAREQLERALTLAQKSGDVRLMLDGLVVMAALAMGQGQSEAASRLLAFVLHHRATTQEARERAERLIDELGGLSAKAQTWARENVHEYATEEIVAQVLQKELETF